MKLQTSGSTKRSRPVECSSVEQRTRRQLLRRIGFGSLGLGLSMLMRKDGRGAAFDRPARAKSCIMIFLFGGPSQLDTWNMKPLSPVEYRGEFQPIETSAPGVEWCEHLPGSARMAHRVAVVRSLSMTGRGIGDHHAMGITPEDLMWTDRIGPPPKPARRRRTAPVVLMRRLGRSRRNPSNRVSANRSFLHQSLSACGEFKERRGRASQRRLTPGSQLIPLSQLFS